MIKVFVFLFLTLLIAYANAFQMKNMKFEKSLLSMSDMGGDLPARTFAAYIIYKGKGAASVKSVKSKSKPKVRRTIDLGCLTTRLFKNLVHCTKG